VYVLAPQFFWFLFILFLVRPMLFAALCLYTRKT